MRHWIHFEHERTQCSPCPAGFSIGNHKSTHPALKGCYKCGAFSIAPNPKSLGCTACPKNAFANEERTSCVYCPSGQIYAKCFNCSIGTYSNNSIDPAQGCVPCPPGTASTVEGSVSCNPCAAGEFFNFPTFPPHAQNACLVPGQPKDSLLASRAANYHALHM